MARIPKSRRIFGGKNDTAAAANSQRYTRELMNEADEAQAETLTVGTTRRVLRGPGGQGGFWSYHINNLSASGATSTLKIYFSNLPNPDPTNSAHWKDSGITAIDLTVVAATQATRASDYYEWILFEAIAVTTAGTLWGYARVTEDGQG